MIEFDSRMYCNKCNDAFDKPVRAEDYDDSLFDSTSSQADKDEPVCPLCGSSEFEEVQHRCEECGDYLPDDQLKVCDGGDFYLCQGCIDAMKQKREDEDVTEN